MKNPPEEYLVGLYFMARILQRAPDADFARQMAQFASELFDWPGVEAEEAAAMRAAVGEGLLAPRLAEDHARLFSGPDPLAPPWESVWLEREGLLYGEKTEEARRFYLDWKIDAPANEPADHLGFELAFLAWLLDRPEDYSISGMSAADAASLILHEHIMAYAPLVLEQAAKRANTSFYKQASLNCLAMLRDLVEQG